MYNKTKRTNKCKYGRTRTDKDCRICTMYGKCELTEGRAEGYEKAYLLVDIGTELFLVFASKREGYKQNIVFRAEVVKATVDKDGVTYNCEINRCMNDKTLNIDSYTKFYMFRNANIDTGHRGIDKQYYPVFTTKERCLQWLRE